MLTFISKNKLKTLFLACWITAIVHKVNEPNHSVTNIDYSYEIYITCDSIETFARMIKNK